jgi:hypothetical protein
VVVATKLFAAKNPEAKKLARELFADHATILAALGR